MRGLRSLRRSGLDIAGFSAPCAAGARLLGVGYGLLRFG